MRLRDSSKIRTKNNGRNRSSRESVSSVSFGSNNILGASIIALLRSQISRQEFFDFRRIGGQDVAGIDQRADRGSGFDLVAFVEFQDLVITHDLGVVAGMCDRVVVMKSGEIVRRPYGRYFRQAAASVYADAAGRRPRRRQIRAGALGTGRGIAGALGGGSGAGARGGLIGGRKLADVRNALSV